MSTEDDGRGGALRRYRRRSLAVVLVLAALGTGLAVLNGAQGPRLTSAEVNARSVVERSGQRLVLHANQPLAWVSASQVTVSPAAPVAEVSTDGSALTVRFARPLRYAEEYRVQVSGTKGLYTGAAADLTWSFDTADPTVYSLVRATVPAADGSDSPDRIFGHRLSAADAPVEVFRAPRIQEYAAVDSALAAVVLGPDDTPSLVLQSLTDHVSATVNTGSAATIRALRSSASAGMFGYVVSGGSGDPQNGLFILDLSDPSAVPREITDFSGRPFAVIDWLFVPGTTSVVVQATDHQVFVVDVLDPARIVPFGSHGSCSASCRTHSDCGSPTLTATRCSIWPRGRKRRSR